MKVVLDASAAVAFLLGKEKAEAIGKVIAEAESVLVPDLFASEITNALWKCYAFGGLPMPECEAALAAALDLPDHFAPSREIAAEAFSLSCLTKASAYDMVYAVLTRRSAAELLTLDGKLVKICKQQGIRIVAL